ncbi:Retrovirus-related Pol polyprotein from transposon TNT 1-94 [Nymphaea thermarum]|nr:Retrovirus-related Pol polyprotein from transposon TNT 1-94 [Nymphaea thermarum]
MQRRSSVARICAKEAQISAGGADSTDAITHADVSRLCLFSSHPGGGNNSLGRVFSLHLVRVEPSIRPNAQPYYGPQEVFGADAGGEERCDAKRRVAKGRRAMKHCEGEESCEALQRKSTAKSSLTTITGLWQRSMASGGLQPPVSPSGKSKARTFMLSVVGHKKKYIMEEDKPIEEFGKYAWNSSHNRQQPLSDITTTPSGVREDLRYIKDLRNSMKVLTNRQLIMCSNPTIVPFRVDTDHGCQAPPKYIDREVKKTIVGDQAAGTPAGSEIRFEYETLTENNIEYEVWLAHDQSLVAYITSTLSEEVLGGIDDDLTALELWSTLATTYSQVSEARFLQLRRQFQDIKRGTRTVLEYLNEIKSVSDQLAAIGHPVSDKDKVQQALSGLGTDFDIFCTALEVLPILPSFEDLKAKLFQQEASRVQRQNLIPSNSHNVLIIGTHALQGNRTRPWTSQAGMGRCILPTPPGMNAMSSMSRRVPSCFYCNKRGHVKSECWHNPQNKNNQISLSKLIDDTHSSVEFTPSSVYVKDARTKKTFAEGTRKGDMYVLEEDPKLSKPHPSDSCFPSHSEVNVAEYNKPSIWHGRQGAEMLPERKEQAVNEPETLVSSSLDNTTSLDSLPSSSQPNDPPIDNRFSSLDRRAALADCISSSIVLLSILSSQSILFSAVKILTESSFMQPSCSKAALSLGRQNSNKTIGHSRERCFKLNGYPPNFREGRIKGDKVPKPNSGDQSKTGFIAATSNTQSNDSGKEPALAFTTEEFLQLKQILKDRSTPLTSFAGGGGIPPLPPPPGDPDSGSLLFAGNIRGTRCWTGLATSGGAVIRLLGITKLELKVMVGVGPGRVWAGPRSNRPARQWKRAGPRPDRPARGSPAGPFPPRPSRSPAPPPPSCPPYPSPSPSSSDLSLSAAPLDLSLPREAVVGLACTEPSSVSPFPAFRRRLLLPPLLLLHLLERLGSPPPRAPTSPQPWLASPTSTLRPHTLESTHLAGDAVVVAASSAHAPGWRCRRRHRLERPRPWLEMPSSSPPRAPTPLAGDAVLVVAASSVHAPGWRGDVVVVARRAAGLGLILGGPARYPARPGPTIFWAGPGLQARWAGPGRVLAGRAGPARPDA